MGVKGIIQTLPSLSPLLHLSERVCKSGRSERRREREEERERGVCESSERSGEEAEAQLIFSLCRTHHCSQTSGLTLITHIYRQGGGERGEGSASIFEPQKNYPSPLIHPFHSSSSPFLLFPLPSFSFTPLLSLSSLLFPL